MIRKDDASIVERFSTRAVTFVLAAYAAVLLAHTSQMI